MTDVVSRVQLSVSAPGQRDRQYRWLTTSVTINEPSAPCGGSVERRGRRPSVKPAAGAATVGGGGLPRGAVAGDTIEGAESSAFESPTSPVHPRQNLQGALGVKSRPSRHRHR